MGTDRFGTYQQRNVLHRNATIINFAEDALDLDPELKNVTIARYGEQRLYETIRDYNADHNETIRMLMSSFVVFTSQRIEPYAEQIGVSRIRGTRVDELGLTDAVRGRVPAMESSNIGYPLDRVQYDWQVTRDYTLTASPYDLLVRQAQIQAGDIDDIEYALRLALFKPTSNTTYRDYLTDQLNIPVRALANGDGQMLPLGPKGEVFDGSTHQHYMGRVGTELAATDISAAVHNVVEHGLRGPLEIWTSEEDIETLQQFTDNFYMFDPEEVVNVNPGFDTMVLAGNNPRIPTVDAPNPDNMYYGKWNAKYLVASKPWMYPGYYMVVDRGRRVVKWRIRQNVTEAFGAQGLANLRIVANFDMFPLRGETMEREFGLGIGDRVGAAILYAGGTSYVQPTITKPALY